MREKLSRELGWCQAKRAELYDELFKIEKAIVNSYHYNPKDYELFFSSSTYNMLKQKKKIVKKIKTLDNIIKNLRKNINICDKMKVGDEL